MTSTQNQQNIIKPTNHKKIGGYFCGEFSNLGQNKPNKTVNTKTGEVATDVAEKATEVVTDVAEKATEVEKETAKTNEDKAEDNVPTEYKNALKRAKSYDKTSHMSKQGLYDQLTSEFEQFTPQAPHPRLSLAGPS